jgi:predicted RNA methylase
MQVTEQVRFILERADFMGRKLVIRTQLDRALYAEVNKVLEALGGKWEKREKAHIFPEDARDTVMAALAEGRVETAQEAGWFPTPPHVVEQLIELAHLPDQGCYILEPSAGEGAIAGPLLARGHRVDMVEKDHGRARKLYDLIGTPSDHRQQGRSAGGVVAMDFMAFNSDRCYDRVIMNPPFAGKTDVEHVDHALRMLKPGGRLVAVMSAGIAFRKDKATAGLLDRSTLIKQLPEGTFKQSGTSVNTVIAIFDAPEAEDLVESRPFKAEKQDYSFHPWRVLSRDGDQIWRLADFDHPNLGPTPVHQPIAFSTAREAKAWIKADQAAHEAALNADRHTEHILAQAEFEEHKRENAKLAAPTEVEAVTQALRLNGALWQWCRIKEQPGAARAAMVNSHAGSFNSEWHAQTERRGIEVSRAFGAPIRVVTFDRLFDLMARAWTDELWAEARKVIGETGGSYDRALSEELIARAIGLIEGDQLVLDFEAEAAS